MFRFSRSAGPGGQNVNKLNTRVTVLFDVVDCEFFSDIQKKRILKHLASRAGKNGVIRVSSQKYRTQKANKASVIKRLGELLAESLKEKPVRKRTKVPQWAREKRLAKKKQRGVIKKQRTEKSFEF